MVTVPAFVLISPLVDPLFDMFPVSSPLGPTNLSPLRTCAAVTVASVTS